MIICSISDYICVERYDIFYIGYVLLNNLFVKLSIKSINFVCDVEKGYIYFVRGY